MKEVRTPGPSKLTMTVEMSLFTLIAVLLIGLVLNQVLILAPLSWLHLLNVSNWITLSLLLVLFAWCFGE